MSRSIKFDKVRFCRKRSNGGFRQRQTPLQFQLIDGDNLGGLNGEISRRLLSRLP